MDAINHNFDLNLYRVFYMVAQTKSISKAAELLFVSQPAVSYSIKTLEEALELSCEEGTLNDLITQKTAKIGEKLRRSFRWQAVFSYAKRSPINTRS